MERALLVIGLLVICLLAAYGLRRGWRSRAARQSHLPALPVLPPDPGPDLLPPLTGLYVSTTTAGQWQDRIVTHTLGRRAAGAARLLAAGICIERDGEVDIFVPAGDLVEVTTAPGIAGKVTGQRDGILIFRWLLGDTLLDSGFRADDRDAQAEFVRRAGGVVQTAPEAAPTPGTDNAREPDSPTKGTA